MVAHYDDDSSDDDDRHDNDEQEHAYGSMHAAVKADVVAMGDVAAVG